MAHYLKDIYRLYKLGKSTGGSYIIIEELLFVHIKDEKIWIIGVKYNETYKIRIDVFKSRNKEDMKTFIYNHIWENNTIIIDGWNAYNFLDDSNYIHEVHIHGPQGNFCLGLHSINLILRKFGVYSKLKKLKYIIAYLLTIYTFLREAEFRYILSKLDDDKKEKKLLIYLNIYIL